ncbi:hypothetical protein FOL47_008529, partial [Perkinsus chesapeaki]
DPDDAYILKVKEVLPGHLDDHASTESHPYHQRQFDTAVCLPLISKAFQMLNNEDPLKLTYAKHLRLKDFFGHFTRDPAGHFLFPAVEYGTAYGEFIEFASGGQWTVEQTLLDGIPTLGIDKRDVPDLKI